MVELCVHFNGFDWLRYTWRYPADTFLGDALTEMMVGDSGKWHFLKEYEWRMKIYTTVKVKGKTRYRSFIKNCFDLLALPLSKLINFISPETKKICRIKVYSTYLCVSDYRRQFLAWNQQCDYQTYRFICQAICGNLLVARRARKSSQLFLDYLYFHWGRPYMILKYGKTQIGELRNIMDYICQVLFKVYFTQGISEIMFAFREGDSWISTSK